ncbi:winged helix-turn-helix domain-containing protein [Streptomyces sp. NPDC051940]|uniref:ArsR/SmtB family transcription factor n=1 Tax=Streptomyces sp. NPDC051940 TaxID=3155675 RepID=UPI003447F77C
MSSDPASDASPPGTHISLDAKGLRALAHPVRVEMLTLLRKHGPSTATRIGERLGINSGAASYHLRQLAAAGFVAEDTGRGNARERWWRSLHDRTVLRDPELARQEPEAVLAYLQSVVTSHNLHVQQTLAQAMAMPPAWQEVIDMSNWRLRLTPEQTLSMRSELADVITRYQHAESDDERAEPVTLLTYVLPGPEES